MLFIGTISVLYLIIVLVAMLVIWPLDLTKTFSRHAARERSSTIYYFIVFAIFLAMFGPFMLNWFADEYSLGGFFSALVLAGIAGQLGAITIPETGGKKSTIHIASAGIMAISVLLQTALITTRLDLSTPLKLFGWAALAFMVLVWVVTILVPKSQKHSLLLQSGYFLGYLFLVLGVAHYG